MKERLVILRKALGLSQPTFAKTINISQGYLSELEHGKKPLVERIQELICLKYNVRIEWLRDGLGDMFVSKKSDASRIIEIYETLSPELQTILFDLAETLAKRQKTEE